MSDALDAKTLANIARAQTCGGRPIRDRVVPYGSFGAMLEERARERGGRPYLVYLDDEAGERREYTYKALYDRALALAAHLQSLGLGPGDRVATMAYNHAETVVVYFATWLLGGCAVPVNLSEDDERVRFIVNNAEAKAVFVMPDQIGRAEKHRPHMPGVAHWLQIHGAPEMGYTAMEAAIEDGAKRLAAGANPRGGDLDTDALIVYTSGTTGAPKGVVLNQYNLLADAYAIAQWHKLDAEARLMCVLPIHHVNGIVVTLVTPAFVGGTAILCRKFHVKGFWRKLAEHKVHIVSVVPTLLAFLVEENEDRKAADLSAFRYFVCGAGPLTVELAERFEDRFGLRILHGYGLSETTCYSCFLPIDLTDAEHRGWMRKHGFPSIGVPVATNEMDIHTPDGKSVPEGERGEIVIRGHNVMRYYYRRPDANAETFANGWFRSGDEGFLLRDEKGRPFFFITGRIKELIIRGGVNLSPFEIDEVLNRIPGVQCGLAVAFDNNFYGEEVGAYVKLAPGASLSEAEILAAAAKELPFPKQPKVVVFGEEVPVTSTGKYQRNRLKPLFEKWRDVQFRKK